MISPKSPAHRRSCAESSGPTVTAASRRANVEADLTTQIDPVRLLEQLDGAWVPARQDDVVERRVVCLHADGSAGDVGVSELPQAPVIPPADGVRRSTLAATQKAGGIVVIEDVSRTLSLPGGDVAVDARHGQVDQEVDSSEVVGEEPDGREMKVEPLRIKVCDHQVVTRDVRDDSSQMRGIVRVPVQDAHVGPLADATAERVEVRGVRIAKRVRVERLRERECFEGRAGEAPARRLFDEDPRPSEKLKVVQLEPLVLHRLGDRAEVTPNHVRLAGRVRLDQPRGQAVVVGDGVVFVVGEVELIVSGDDPQVVTPPRADAGWPCRRRQVEQVRVVVQRDQSTGRRGRRRIRRERWAAASRSTRGRPARALRS